MKETHMTTKNAKTKPEAEEAPAVPVAPKDARAELNRQFAEADEKGKAEIIEEVQASLGVRGF